jgi:hypothetical protein
LSLGESEAKIARKKATELERAMRNDEEGCFRTLLFDIVEPSGSPWPCGRCAVCMEVGERPRARADRHEFSVTWPDQAWVRPCVISGGSWVINPDEPAIKPLLDRLVARLAGIGIEQFVTTADTMDALEEAVCESSADFGFTLVLGGDVPPCRVPTAVIVANTTEDPEVLRKHCMELSRQFENDWKEVPILFVLSTEPSGVGSALSQHLSSQAPMAEQVLTMIGSCT